MNVVFEESGSFKAATILTQTEASLQVELPGGRRSKIKAASVMLQFEQPSSERLMEQAEALRLGMDLNFLWECAPAGEFAIDDFAADYFSGKPAPEQHAGLLFALHAAPAYFHRKGRGRYAKAPEDILKAALAALDRKAQQQQQVDSWAQEMQQGSLPKAVAQKASELLFAPDKMSLEFRALQAACATSNLSPARLLLGLAAFKSERALHEAGFMREHFPNGRGFANGLGFRDRNSGAIASAFAEKLAGLANKNNKNTNAHNDAAKPGTKTTVTDSGESASDAMGALAYALLPLSKVRAFSIDDSSTTEIDDCLSVTAWEGGWQVGVHIAAPGLAIKPREALDKVARLRMSTVYMPGDKITMLPDNAIRAFSLDQGREVPVLSLYARINTDATEVVTYDTKVERLVVFANLRHDKLDEFVSEESLEAPAMPDSWQTAPNPLNQLWQELSVLWKLTKTLTTAREQVRGRPEGRNRSDFSFAVDAGTEQVIITERRRDAPLDRIVAELMILANSQWGKLLADHKVPGIYRSQSFGRVKMTIHPQAHQGLGVAQYGWFTSPLRRYTDLVNQRQVIAVARNDKPPYLGSDADLYAVISQFDAKYGAYADFQTTMERYWCLRWIAQEQLQARIEAVLVREELARFVHAPFYFRLSNVPAGVMPGRHLWVQVLAMDLLDLTVEARFLELGEEGAVDVVEAVQEEQSAPAELPVEPLA